MVLLSREYFPSRCTCRSGSGCVCSISFVRLHDAAHTVPVGHLPATTATMAKTDSNWFSF
jgi:hypothetical protein